MPQLNSPVPFGSPVPLASLSKSPDPTSSAITVDQITLLLIPLAQQAAPVIARALAEGVVAWIQAASPRSGEGGGVAPEITDAQS